jgi:hypothetical protein
MYLLVDIYVWYAPHLVFGSCPLEATSRANDSGWRARRWQLVSAGERKVAGALEACDSAFKPRFSATMTLPPFIHNDEAA